MRYYTTSNGAWYDEDQPLWDIYTRYPEKSWYREPLEPKHVIRFWRDIDGSRLPVIKWKDLIFSEWFFTRIRCEACLPQYYTAGNRFIRITRAFPAGFKCEPQPLNLREARGVRKYERLKARQRARERKELRKLEKLAKAKLKARK